MNLLRFARKHVFIFIGLINVVLVITSIQLTSARQAGSFEAPTASASSAAVSPSQVAKAPAAATPCGKACAASSPASAAAAKAPAASLPIAGKGMWIWLFPQVEGGNPSRIVRKAQALGLTHIYVRSSSTASGFKWIRDIERIVPVAHAAGIKVIAWDFPKLINPDADAARMIAIIDHRIPGNHRVDGMAVDLETSGEGVSLTKAKAQRLAVLLQQRRPDAFRVLVPPRPTLTTKRTYPYHIIKYFDAVAPMVYWHQRDAGLLAVQSVQYLKQFGRPVAPVGQAYDSALDPGGKPGRPKPYTLSRFAAQAKSAGAVGVSFWSWQHATPDMFEAIARMNFPPRSIE